MVIRTRLRGLRGLWMGMGAGAVMMREGVVVVLDDGVLAKGGNFPEGEDVEEGKKGTVIRVWIYIRLFHT